MASGGEPLSLRRRRGTWPSHHPVDLSRAETKHAFQAKSSTKEAERLRIAGQEAEYTVLYLGIAANQIDESRVVVAFSIFDGTYNVDFSIQHLCDSYAATTPEFEPSEYAVILTRSNSSSSDISGGYVPHAIADHFVNTIREYAQEHKYKFAGAGISQKLATMTPELSSRLWTELDIVPIVFEQNAPNGRNTDLIVDEEADSMARKCCMYFAPTGQPRLQVGYQNVVEVDSGGHVQLTTYDMYKSTVHENTWRAAEYFAEALKRDNVRIAFFNSTPQGGGVALMRHALIRFFRVMGVDCKWYVPKPKPAVFRITKTNHNILQGVADPKERLTGEQQDQLDQWASDNASKFWLADGGPLRSRAEQGADVVIVDDPQMPILAKIAKEQDPDRPVIFRSHIQVRADLADNPETPTSEVWKWIWDRVKVADLFISHPVREFIPGTVNVDRVGYLPAATDWLDGLNKPLSEFDINFYMHEFNTECKKHSMPELDYQNRKYIVQIARFDPSKGIPQVVAAYAELRGKYMANLPRERTPQLVIAGHGAIDDPDASEIYNQTLGLLEKHKDIIEDVVVMRVGPTDQILNALMSKAHVALQLSTREGFEVKVSEAQHKGIPIIASNAGGIPLQFVDKGGGFLVEPGDYRQVAKKLYELFTDTDLHTRTSFYATTHVSDEVGTVGNALAWMYLAHTLASGEKIQPAGSWITDMARKAAGVQYENDEHLLLRKKELRLR